MPNCFCLIRKSAPQEGPVSLAKIDDEMCAALGASPDPVQYLCSWYDFIGFGLATGRSWSELRARYKDNLAEAWADPDPANWSYPLFDVFLLRILDWLEENFTSDAWAEIGRR